MRGWNKYMGGGNLGRDAETRFTANGNARTTFSFAVTDKWNDRTTGEAKESTEWINCVAWGKEGVAKYLTKGKGVAVEGKLTTRRVESTDGGRATYYTEVVVSDIQLLGGDNDQRGGTERPSQRSAPSRQAQTPSGKPETPAASYEAGDDDVPF